jgi:hypothetical protein
LEIPAAVAKAIVDEIQDLQVVNTPEIRRIRRKYSNILEKASPKVILDTATKIIRNYGIKEQRMSL